MYFLKSMYNKGKTYRTNNYRMWRPWKRNWKKSEKNSGKKHYLWPNTKVVAQNGARSQKSVYSAGDSCPIIPKKSRSTRACSLRCSLTTWSSIPPWRFTSRGSAYNNWCHLSGTVPLKWRTISTSAIRAVQIWLTPTSSISSGRPSSWKCVEKKCRKLGPNDLRF